MRNPPFAASQRALAALTRTAPDGGDLTDMFHQRFHPIAHKRCRDLPNLVLNNTSGIIPRAMAPAGGMKAAQKPTYFSKNVVASAARPAILTILFAHISEKLRPSKTRMGPSIPIVCVVDV